MKTPFFPLSPDPGSHLSPTAGFKAELVVHREEPFLALNLSCKYTEKKKKKKKKKEEKKRKKEKKRVQERPSLNILHAVPEGDEVVRDQVVGIVDAQAFNDVAVEHGPRGVFSVW